MKKRSEREKERHRKEQRRYNKTERGKRYQAYRNIKKKYGLTDEKIYHIIDVRRAIPCEICGELPDNDRPLDIDHNHKTGKVRGLLCHKCNLAVSAVENYPNDFNEVFDYLEKYANGN